MKEVVTMTIEKVVRETWIVGNEQTAQKLFDLILNGETEKAEALYYKKGGRVVSAEILSQETKTV